MQSKRHKVPVRSRGRSAPASPARTTRTQQKPARRLPRHAPVGVQLQRSGGPGQLARQRRKRMYIKLAVWVLAFVAIIGGVAGLSHVNTFALNNVSVTGTQMLSAAAVTSVVDEELSGRTGFIFSKRNVFLYSKDKIAAHLQEKFPALQSATIEANGITSGDLLVRIQERTAYALWCADALTSSCYAMDSNGFIFASGFQAGVLDTGLVTFTGGLATTTDPIGATVLPHDFDNIVATINALATIVGQPVSVAIHDEKVSVKYPSGMVVHFTAERSNKPDILAANLRTALEADALIDQSRDNIEYIDLRFENRLYYRLRGIAEDIEN